MLKILIYRLFLPALPKNLPMHYSYLILLSSPIIPLLFCFVIISSMYSYPQFTVHAYVRSTDK